MAEDLSPIDDPNVLHVEASGSEPASDLVMSSHNPEKSRLIDQLEQQLTPEMLEAVERKLEVVSDETRPFAMRLMSLQEFQQIMEEGKISFGYCNIANIQALREWTSEKSLNIYFSDWAGAVDHMTNWSNSAYPMISEQQMISAYKDALKSREGGKEQVQNLDSLLAETVSEFVLNLYRASESDREYDGPASLHFYEKDKDIRPDRDHDGISDRIRLALSSLEQPTPQQEKNGRRRDLSDSDKQSISASLKNFPEFTMDDRRVLMKFLRTSHNVGRGDEESFAPYQILTIWPEECAEKSYNFREERPWGDFHKDQDVSRMLAVLSLTPNRAVYEELAQLMAGSGNPENAFPISTPEGKLIFPSQRAVTKAKDMREAEKIRLEMEAQHEAAKNEYATHLENERQTKVSTERTEQQNRWIEEADRRNNTRGFLDKLRRRNFTTWQDISRDEAERDRSKTGESE